MPDKAFWVRPSSKPFARDGMITDGDDKVNAEEEEHLVCDRCGQMVFGVEEGADCLRKIFGNEVLCVGKVRKLKTVVEGFKPQQTGCVMCGGKVIRTVCRNCGWQNYAG